MNIAKQFDELMANLRAHYPLQARQFEGKMSRLDKKAIEELRTFDGEDGLKKALEESPDLILLDIMNGQRNKLLRKMKGTVVIRAI